MDRTVTKLAKRNSPYVIVFLLVASIWLATSCADYNADEIADQIAIIVSAGILGCLKSLAGSD
jgi:hypothetical protein